ncbi:WD40 repeat-like protein [Tilletiaria anomala UBC 951]|uniref:WD40 repeat-like protein n=1 Tax=Tilletiaria anomala (strain ATCC 24038 / CBS 436.72 / UBC 951) TaxID=1037660 RepID=A0A066VC71_TILAU|nr:WD40 repeat-like protein [Tilletiaria anomala UBC 951]KDN39086.1 WD40 repeat-like protein [Tilletiaria anomala UBC 951]
MKRPTSQGIEEEEEEEEEDGLGDGLTPEERAANKAAQEAHQEDEDDSESSADLGPEPEEGVQSELPISHEAVLKDHNKVVSALDIDAAGARIATGGYDYDVKLWDFGGMTSALRPFKTFEPNGSYSVHDLKWSPSGNELLVVSGTSQPKVYTRDGQDGYVYKKGDVYIRDMKQTSGHVAELSCGDWHPHTANTFLTASADSSIRLWDVEDRAKQKTVIVVKSKERGTRTRITKAKFSHDGRYIAATCLDGALHFWATNSNFSRPSASLEGAHTRNTETTGLAWSADGHSVVTRGGSGDETVKLWDMRSLKRAVAIAEDLPNNHAETDVIFSLDERTILTGTSAQGNMEASSVTSTASSGSVNVLSRLDLSLQRQISISTTDSPPGAGTSIVRLQWQPKINQLFCSTSTGAIHVFYSPEKSARGALLAVGKAPRRRRDVEDYFISAPADGGDQMLQITVSGDGGTMVGRSAASKRRKLEKSRADPQATRMPERPLQGPGRGGRIGAAATQHVVQNIYRDITRDEDPREALLRFAEKEKKDGPKYTSAWSKTQPKPVFREVDEEEEKRR